MLEVVRCFALSYVYNPEVTSDFVEMKEEDWILSCFLSEMSPSPEFIVTLNKHQLQPSML